MLSCRYLSSNTGNELSQKEEVINYVVMPKTDTTKLRLSKGVEKVIIEYWSNYYANNFVFTVLSSKAKTEITYKGEVLFTEKKTLKDSVACNRLITYINQFYIDKKDSIILKKLKNNETLITDYPSIRVLGYKKEKEIFNTKTQIGEEEYDVEFNPIFLEFYEFLDNLVKQR